MVGRLVPDLSPAEANRRMVPLAQQLEATYPATNEGNYFEARALMDTMVGEVRPDLRVLFAAVATLLLIAFVNITSLVLARSASRERELAVRTAMGATRSRLGQLLVVESLVLAVVGGGLGILVAHLGLQSLLALSAGSIPRMDTITMNLPVLGFAAGTSVLTGIVVGSMPMWRWRGRRATGPAEVLHGAKSSMGKRAVNSRRMLVTVELALALILTVGAGLLVKSFAALSDVDPSVDTDRLLAFDMRLPGGDRFAEQERVARFVEDAMMQVEGIAGVERASAALTAPVDNTGWFNLLTIRDRPVPEVDRPPIGYNVVSSGYFEAVGARLLDGRGFRSEEPLAGQPVTVINRAAAERYWPDESPIGKEVLGNPEEGGEWVQVIGVVENIRQSLTEPPHPEVYVPVAQDRVLAFTVFVRVAGNPTSVALAVDRVIRQADPDIPITNIGSFEDRLGAITARPRFSAALMGGFAGLALVLACVGVYGVLAYSVAQRRREFGIRIAVGATAQRVLSSVLREAGSLSLLAIVAGVVGWLFLARLLETLLFGVTGTDPGTMALAAGAIALVTLGAAVVPARSATGVDPIEVLRDE
jgi:putative ABC transport system permease protein